MSDAPGAGARDAGFDPWRPPNTPASAGVEPEGPGFHPWGPPAEPGPQQGFWPNSAEVTQPIPIHVGTGPTPSESAKPGWTFTDVFVGFGAVLLLSVILNFVVRVIPGLPREATLWLAGFLPIWLGLAGTTWWAARRHGTGRLTDDLGLKFRWVDLAIGLGVGVGLRIVVTLFTAMVQVLSGHRLTSNSETIVGNTRGWPLAVDLILAVSLLAPFVEELFFRGLLLRSALASLSRRGKRHTNGAPNPTIESGRRLRAVAASAILFAVLHLSEITDGFSAVVLIGSLLLVGATNAWLVLRTGRLGAAILTHAVFNGTAAAVLLLTT